MVIDFSFLYSGPYTVAFRWYHAALCSLYQAPKPTNVHFFSIGTPLHRLKGILHHQISPYFQHWQHLLFSIFIFVFVTIQAFCPPSGIRYKENMSKPL